MKLLKDKRVVMTLLAIILVLVVMSSTTYALFFKVHTMENVESYTTGVLEITVEEGTALSLSNSLPMEDSEGSSLTPYTFKVTNTGNLAYTFDLKLLSTTTSNQINSKYIKVKLDNNEPVLLSSLSNGLIASDLTLNPNESVTMSIRIWLSIDTPNTEIGKNFSAKIVTDGVGSEYVVPDTGAYYIESLLTSNPETMNNDDPDGNVRYMGADPNNYVSFNNELWRIIGVFDVASTNGGPTEKRLKIIRNDSIGNYSWDNKPSGTGSSTSSYGSNDWTDSTLMEVLNSGAYWNRTSGTCPSGQNGATTSCNFSSTGLNEEAKNMIGDAVWNLGGTASYTSASTGLASHFYGYERGTTVYSGRPTYWIGKIGLMYPSDYGYATSGGTTTNRASCLAKEMYNWVSSSYSDCKNNDYLYNSSSTQWTMTPRSSNSSNVFGVLNNARLNYFNAYYGYAVLPTAYLKSTVKITGGDGTSENPYTLEMPLTASQETLTKLGLTVNEGTPDFNTVATTNEGIFEAEDDLGISYYFRGAVENNYVKFAGYYWRIIRINGDGTIRMIYDGTSAHANGESSTDRQVGKTAFNSSYNDNAYVGYMYGTPGSSTYNATHTNTNNSTIKTANDNWYKTNIVDKNYSQYVADAIYCNDRSLSSGTGIGTTNTEYMAYNRVSTNKTPSLKCTQANDKFTITSSLGNGDLTYPVGLITADEIAYAGGKYSISNSSYYLYSGQFYVTMSPLDFADDFSYVWVMHSTGYLFNVTVNGSLGLRPVISLKSDTTFSGNGSINQPFEIVS